MSKTGCTGLYIFTGKGKVKADLANSGRPLNDFAPAGMSESGMCRWRENMIDGLPLNPPHIVSVIRIRDGGNERVLRLSALHIQGR